MYKQKLIDLLKSDEQTKTAMEKLEFGCIFKINNESNYDLCKVIGSSSHGDFQYMELHYLGVYIFNSKDKIIEIIGLPLQERFIRMYCENKGIYICITTSGFISGVDIDKPYCKLDNTKDFDNQDDLVYQRIYESLLELN